ncbi:hypothetical protein N431DRAFT_95782 [Stipitochalara longipes BDJ]|nr:hypothetical protein N431DRAFT_95782 [Stipitochalara longipes BDJ]
MKSTFSFCLSTCQPLVLLASISPNLRLGHSKKRVASGQGAFSRTLRNTPARGSPHPPLVRALEHSHVNCILNYLTS